MRTEEVAIVLIVLGLWGAAIGLFFNRWGKIRMLEPYVPLAYDLEPEVLCFQVDCKNNGLNSLIEQRGNSDSS